MPYSKTVQTLVFDELTDNWVPGHPVLVTKGSISAATDSGDGNTAVRLNDGSTIRVAQTLAQIELFLNS